MFTDAIPAPPLRAPGAASNVVEAYAERFASGMLDLSCPSPPPVPLALDASALAAVDLAYAPPGGSSALRARIAARYRTLDRDDVLVTNGASEALAALALALGGPGRRVAVHAGGFPSFAETAAATGATVVPLVPGAAAPADGCDAVLVTNPAVPSGRWVDVARVVRDAVASGAVPVVDEVYRELALDGRPAPAAADLDPRAVSVGDLSKPLGLGGLRVGWVATRDAALRARVARWLRLLGAGPSVLAQEAAVRAFDGFDDRVVAHAARAAERAPAVYRELDRAGWRYAPAEAGLTVLATPPRSVGDAALDALRRGGRFLLRADCFGAPGAFRVALLADPSELRQALARLAAPATPGTLVVLMRAPRLGAGKTRLAAGVGAETAFRLARVFAADTLALAADGAWESLLAFTPRDAAGEVAALAPGAALVPQIDGDLGARIRGALDAALRRGAGPAVLIGSDTPDLDPALIDRAFAALRDGADAVLGPAADGGFYLVGVRRTHPRMFDGVEWSTERVHEQTHAACARLGWSVATIDAWEDVDDVASLDALARRLRASGRAPATRAALATTAGVESRR